MGCFGGGDQPDYNPPKITLPTASDLYGQAQSFGNANMPLAMGARESALQDLQNPTQYYSSFQPTSFEQALGQQQFQNIWPDQQAYMKNQLGMSGMAYSPVAAATLGKAYGDLSTNIGEYLNTQANNRANQSLTSRLAIDPNSFLQPFASLGAGQANNQANLDMGAYNAQYQNQLMQYQQQQQQQQAMGGMLGTIGGLALAPFTGGMSMAPALMGMGSQLGTAAAGGTFNPMSFALSGLSMGSGFGGGGSSFNPSSVAGWGGGTSSYSPLYGSAANNMAAAGNSTFSAMPVS